MWKVHRKRLLNALREYLLTLGVEEEDQHYPFLVPTPAGHLRLKLDESHNGINVFGRFDHVGLMHRALAGITKGEITVPNPYSGKWNFHFDGRKADDAFAHFKNQVDKLMAIRPENSREAEQRPAGDAERHPGSLRGRRARNYRPASRP